MPRAGPAAVWPLRPRMLVSRGEMFDTPNGGPGIMRIEPRLLGRFAAIVQGTEPAVLPVATPSLRGLLGYLAMQPARDLLNERRAITARFVGDASRTAFTVIGAKPTPAAAILGAGVTLHAGPGFKLAFGYDAELRANARSHTIQSALKLRW